MLAKPLPESFNNCVLKSALAVSAENLNGAKFGVGVVELATFAMAFKNQFACTNASSSGVYTGVLKTEDKSFGKCKLLISFSSELFRVSKRIWFLLNAAEPFFVGSGKFIEISDTDARLFTMIGFLGDCSPFASIGFLGDSSPFTRIFTPTGFLGDYSPFTSMDDNWMSGLTNCTFVGISIIRKLGLSRLDSMS